MALTPERINELKEQAVSAWRAAGFEPMLQVFVARAIEAEVHKQDNALILMLVGRLERADKISGYPNNKAAIATGRARLEGNP